MSFTDSGGNVTIALLLLLLLLPVIDYVPGELDGLIILTAVQFISRGRW